MSSRYYEIWRRESEGKLKQARMEKASLESLMRKMKTDEPEIEAKLEEVSRLFSNAEGLHEKLEYPEAIKKSKQALKILKELNYLTLAAKQ